MQKIIRDLPNILAGTLAGLTSYLLFGLANGLWLINFETIVFCTVMGALGASVPTFWEIFSTSRELARISHTWFMVWLMLAISHVAIQPGADAFCFGWMFHLFVDAQMQKKHGLGGAIQLKSSNSNLAYIIIVAAYLLIVLYAIFLARAPVQIVR